MLLDVVKRRSLLHSAVKWNQDGKVLNNSVGSELEGDETPPFLESNVIEPVAALPGFSPENIFVTKLPDFKPNNGIVHHPQHYKLIICDEYPSYSYGSLD